MKFTGKIEHVSAVQTGTRDDGTSWKSCQIVAWNVNESGIQEKIALSCLGDQCEKAQMIAGKYLTSDDSFSGEFDFFFTPKVRSYEDINGLKRYSQEMMLYFVNERTNLTMANLIYIEVGDARIVHDKAVICKEGSQFPPHDPMCEVCAFNGEYCYDIACKPLDRADKKFVYFQPIEKA